MIENIGTREMTDDEIRERIESLEFVLENRAKRDEYTQVARNLYEVYSSYVEAGFTDDQAYGIILELLKAAL